MKKLLLALGTSMAISSVSAQEQAVSNPEQSQQNTEQTTASDSTRRGKRHRKHPNGIIFDGGENKAKLQIYGFVRNYFSFDTREYQGVCGGLYNTLPLPANLNEKGDDLNGNPSMQWMAFTTRVGMNLIGPKLGENCTASGKIEFDFCGFGSGIGATNFVFRIRQAFARLTWQHNMLTLGQTWHPMFNSDMMPATVALATGSPFQPFNRSPQIRYDFRWGENNGWRLTYDLLWQLQYTSPGPDGNHMKYQTYSCVPEMYLGIDHTRKNWMWGIGVDMTSIKPSKTRKETVLYDNGNPVLDDGGKNKTINVKSSDRITSLSPVLFAQLKNDKHFKLMMKAVFAQNTGHLNMPSGYGVKSVDEITGETKYTPLRSLSLWVNPVWTIKSNKTNNLIHWSLFGGYQKNLGSKDPMSTEYVKYSALQHFKYTDKKGNTSINTLDQCFRITPTWAYTIKNFQVAAEYEVTGMTYGQEETDKSGLFTGKVDKKADKSSVINHRACLMVKYSF